jgi:ssDNA-binding Zn-finger/Zn-ribbon topoisomerase 1
VNGNLDNLILAILSSSSKPLKAKEIARQLAEQYGRQVTTKDINSSLYGPLTKSVDHSSDFRWSLLTHSEKTSLPAQNKPTFAGSPKAQQPTSVYPPEAGTSATEGLSMPTCPKCGSRMTIRTAKQGPNAGGQFYGCMKFPACKGTRALIPAENGLEPFSNETPSLEDFPRRIVATPSNNRCQAFFVQCGALPKKAISVLTREDLPQSILRAHTQWQLDMPASSKLAPPSFGPWFAVMEKILKRGRLVSLSPTLEDALRSIAGVGEPSDLED